MYKRAAMQNGPGPKPATKAAAKPATKTQAPKVKDAESFYRTSDKPSKNNGFYDYPNGAQPDVLYNDKFIRRMDGAVPTKNDSMLVAKFKKKAIMRKKLIRDGVGLDD